MHPVHIAELQAAILEYDTQPETTQRPAPAPAPAQSEASRFEHASQAPKAAASRAAPAAAPTAPQPAASATRASTASAAPSGAIAPRPEYRKLASRAQSGPPVAAAGLAITNSTPYGIVNAELVHAGAPGAYVPELAAFGMTSAHFTALSRWLTQEVNAKDGVGEARIACAGAISCGGFADGARRTLLNERMHDVAQALNKEYAGTPFSFRWAQREEGTEGRLCIRAANIQLTKTGQARSTVFPSQYRWNTVDRFNMDDFIHTTMALGLPHDMIKRDAATLQRLDDSRRDSLLVTLWSCTGALIPAIGLTYTYGHGPYDRGVREKGLQSFLNRVNGEGGRDGVTYGLVKDGKEIIFTAQRA